MKLNKKALLTLVGGTVLLSLALVGCTKTEVKEENNAQQEQVAVEEEVATEGEEVVEGEEVAEAVVTPSSELYEKVIEGAELPMSMPVDATLLADVYGLNAEDVASFSVNIPVMNVHATEIAIFEVKDGNVDVIKTAIEKRQADLEKTWETYLPDQLELVKNSQVVEKDNFVLYVISENVDAVVENFNNAFGQAE